VKILIVDDELSMRELLEIVFQEEGFDVYTASGINQAIDLLNDVQVDIIISDLKMEDGTGLDLLKHVQAMAPETIFLLITAYASSDSAIDALKFGAFDYITKPFDVDELKQIVNTAKEKIVQLKTSGEDAAPIQKPPRIIGASPAMIKIYKTIGVISPTDSTILLTGESGTGKELIARTIHEASSRKDHLFVSINCGAFPETLLESELFGYQKGAFTGATTHKRGLFEVAHKGTLFLDEIAETTPTMQVKLLRAIQEKKIRRLGGIQEIDIDVRIIAATNRVLNQRIKEGEFREDLYYRLAVIPIHLPPLRRRSEDIPELASFFLKKYTAKIGKRISGFSPEAIKRLMKMRWKGNVRELENAIERAVTMETTDEIQVDWFLRLESENVLAGMKNDNLSIPDITENGLDLELYLDSVERELIKKALDKTGGVQIEAARLLKLSYRSMRHRMQKLNIKT